jgi:hypothetical protein
MIAIREGIINEVVSYFSPGIFPIARGRWGEIALLRAKETACVENIGARPPYGDVTKMKPGSYPDLLASARIVAQPLGVATP